MKDDIVFGGGHWVCKKCGKTIFGSVDHYCDEDKPITPATVRTQDVNDIDYRWNLIGNLVEKYGTDEERIAWMLCRGDAAEWRLNLKQRFDQDILT